MTEQALRRAGERYGPPQWTIVGGPHTAGGVYLLASSTLSTAELGYWERVAARATSSLLQRPERPVGRFSLALGMADYVLVLAPDYPTAMDTLMRQWRPPPQQQELTT